MTTDRIEIRDLLLRCIVGINPEERVERQTVLVNMILYGDLRAAGASDDIADTVNYHALAQQVADHVERSSYLLLERLAHSIAEIAVRAFEVERIRVTVEKPDALRLARAASVTVERTAADFG